MKTKIFNPASVRITLTTIVSAGLAVVLLSGCSSSFAPRPTASTVQTSLSGIRGSVYGGQQPLVGAHIYVLAAGTTGYGSASKSLLTSVSSARSLHPQTVTRSTM